MRQKGCDKPFDGTVFTSSQDQSVVSSIFVKQAVVDMHKTQVANELSKRDGVWIHV